MTFLGARGFFFMLARQASGNAELVEGPDAYSFSNLNAIASLYIASSSDELSGCCLK